MGRVTRSGSCELGTDLAGDLTLCREAGEPDRLAGIGARQFDGCEGHGVAGGSFPGRRLLRVAGAGVGQGFVRFRLIVDGVGHNSDGFGNASHAGYEDSCSRSRDRPFSPHEPESPERTGRCALPWLYGFVLVWCLVWLLQEAEQDHALFGCSENAVEVGVSNTPALRFTLLSHPPEDVSSGQDQHRFVFHGARPFEIVNIYFSATMAESAVGRGSAATRDDMTLG